MTTLLSNVRRLRWLEIQLLIVPGILSIAGMLMVILVPREKVLWTWRDIWQSLVFILLLSVVNVFLNLTNRKADQLLFPIVSMLCCFSLIMTQRLEPAMIGYWGGGFKNIATKQLIWLVIGTVAMVSTMAIFTYWQPLRWLARYKYTWLIIGIALIGSTFVFGRVRQNDVTGEALWIKIGGFDFQPSEVMKIIIVVFLAAYLDDKRYLLASPYKLGPIRLPPLPYLAPLFLMWGLVFAIIVKQHSIGIAILFYGIFLAMLYIASGKSWYVLAGVGLFAVMAFVSLYGLGAASESGRIHQRVSIWLFPFADAQGDGWQIVQSMYAFASGGILGSGINQGSPYLIPEAHTDFIFAAIGEEMGLAGTIGLIGLYLLLIFRGYHIALKTRNGFYQLLAAGLTTILGLQAFIIIGGVIKLIPLTGITLPFISYGGSSLLTNFIIVGLLLRISATGE